MANAILNFHFDYLNPSLINCHVPVCHAFESSCKWVMRLFRHVNVMSYKCFVMCTELASKHPSWKAGLVFGADRHWLKGKKSSTIINNVSSAQCSFLDALISLKTMLKMKSFSNVVQILSHVVWYCFRLTHHNIVNIVNVVNIFNSVNIFNTVSWRILRDIKESQGISRDLKRSQEI